MKICAQIVKIYAQPFKSYIPYFYPPPYHISGAEI